MQTLPDEVMFEETYFYNKRSGHSDQEALRLAREQTLSAWEDRQEIPAKMRNSRFENPVFLAKLMNKDSDMSNQLTAFNHPNAPTLQNARARGLVAGPTNPRVGPRKVVSSGLNSSTKDITATRRRDQANRAVNGIQRENDPETISPAYKSVDGHIYRVLTKTGGRPVKGAALSIILHALAEEIKGGDPLKVLGACMTSFDDAHGHEVINFRELYFQKYGDPDTEPQEDDNPEGINFA